MDNFSNSDFSADYQALKAENDRLREEAKLWLWNSLELLCGRAQSKLSGKAGGAALQVGRQDWQFRVEGSVMVGERFGVRYLTRTLIVAAGWPRLAEHGFVPDGGLARARVGLSQNIMLEPITIAELILKRHAKDAPIWYVIEGKKIGQQITEYQLGSYLSLLLEFEI